MIKKALAIELTEADVKSGVEDYLTTKRAQRNLWFTRLNSGDFIVESGSSRRRIKGCGKGTADYLVIQHDACVQNLWHHRVVFLELKSTRGRQSKEQFEFEHEIHEQGAEYYIVRDASELISIIGDDLDD